MWCTRGPDRSGRPDTPKPTLIHIADDLGVS